MDLNGGTSRTVVTILNLLSEILRDMLGNTFVMPKAIPPTAFSKLQKKIEHQFNENPQLLTSYQHMYPIIDTLLSIDTLVVDGERLRDNTKSSAPMPNLSNSEKAIQRIRNEAPNDDLKPTFTVGACDRQASLNAHQLAKMLYILTAFVQVQRTKTGKTVQWAFLNLINFVNVDESQLDIVYNALDHHLKPMKNRAARFYVMFLGIDYHLTAVIFDLKHRVIEMFNSAESGKQGTGMYRINEGGVRDYERIIRRDARYHVTNNILKIASRATGIKFRGISLQPSNVVLQTGRASWTCGSWSVWYVLRRMGKWSPGEISTAMTNFKDFRTTKANITYVTSPIITIVKSMENDLISAFENRSMDVFIGVIANHVFNNYDQLSSIVNTDIVASDDVIQFTASAMKTGRDVVPMAEINFQQTHGTCNIM
jgi:hypothetical protein